MQPLAVVTLFLGTMYVAGRGGFALAPRSTASFYRRTLCASERRMRLLGAFLLLSVAVPLVVTVRGASGPEALLALLQILGWVSAVVSVSMLAAPDVLRRFVSERLLGASDSFLRIRGILGVGFGGFLNWAAFALL